jgi:trimethylamine--corrinoid protein Co-methyltransferase
MSKGRDRREKRRAQSRDGRPSGQSRPLSLPPFRFSPLSEDQVERIDEASRRILAETGLTFDGEEALSLFRQAGAQVKGTRVYFPAELIDACLVTSPERYTLHGRNPANDLTIGGDCCAVMPGGGPPYVLDLEGARRPGTLADLNNFTRLGAMSPEVHVMARKAVEAQDIDPAIRHLACWYSILTLADKPGQSGFAGGLPEAEDALQMLAIVFGGEAAIDGRPVAHCSVNVNSPLHYDRPMLESLIQFARFGQPVLISPFVMAGVTGPTTLAGTLAQHNAEVLAGVALVQLVRPGCPVLYGTASSNVDMRNAAPAIGSPESALTLAACAQLARRYGLPCRGGGALTDSPLPDAQSNYERMFTLLTSILSGVNYLMQALGVLESYLTISYAQYVIDLELIEMLRRLVRPLEVSDDTLALDTIAEVGPGGHFLETAHTLSHYRDAHFIPRVSIRQPYDEWLSGGARDAVERASQRCREMLDDYVKPPMDPSVAGQLRDFVARRVDQLRPGTKWEELVQD